MNSDQACFEGHEIKVMNLEEQSSKTNEALTARTTHLSTFGELEANLHLEDAAEDAKE